MKREKKVNPADLTDLVARLRASANDKALAIGNAWNLLHEAADAVEKLSAEVEQLKGEALARTKALALVELSLESPEGTRSVQIETGGTAPESVQCILDGIVGLRAEVERLKQELAEARKKAKALDDLEAWLRGPARSEAVLGPNNEIDGSVAGWSCELWRAGEFRHVADLARTLAAAIRAALEKASGQGGK